MQGVRRSVLQGVPSVQLQCARTIREVSGPGPSGVKSHTGANANAATAPICFLTKKILSDHFEKYFQTTLRHIFGVANVLDNVQDSCLL